MKSYLQIPVLSLARVLRRENCSAVICQEYEYTRFDLLVALGRLLRIPVFGSFQGGSANTSALEQRIRKASVRRCAGLMIASPPEARRVEALYGIPEQKILTTPTPIMDEDMRRHDRSAARVAVGIPADARVAVWHGRIGYHVKGLDLLLDAWRIVRAQVGQPVLLLLIGTGAEEVELRRGLAELGGEDVVWLNRYIVDRDEMARHLSAADVYVFPSRWEGFAMAPIEAMRCGLPLVATVGSGAEPILQDGEASGGVLVPPAAEALAAALTRLLVDADLRLKLAQAAQARVATGFTSRAIGAQLTEFVTSGHT